MNNNTKDNKEITAQNQRKFKLVVRDVVWEFDNRFGKKSIHFSKKKL